MKYYLGMIYLTLDGHASAPLIRLIEAESFSEADEILKVDAEETKARFVTKYKTVKMDSVVAPALKKSL